MRIISLFTRLSFAVALTILSAVQTVHAHNVGQVQTTIYFAPETLALLNSRAATGSGAGFMAGDVVHYIISFQPVPNPAWGAACAGGAYASTGVNGYITDYIPLGTQVVGAGFVNADGTTLSVPNLPGPMIEGAAQVFNPGIFAAYASGALPDLYADTGIFYSSDFRTALDATTIGTGNIAQQGQPGYYVNPLRGPCLAALIDPAITTMSTHNLWDADQTNAFGTIALPVMAPQSAAPMVIPNAGVGSGLTLPLNVGSPVAGPDTGFKLDNTGLTGPWQRIYAPGSTIGCATGCAATTGAVTLATRATPTSMGALVSEASPLPTTVNAIRWSVGQLIVGQPRYVKLSLKLLSDPPATGLINSAEVSGGDSDGSTSRDNPWIYWVASTASNNSALYIQKQITHVCTFAQYRSLLLGQDASSCPAYTGGNIPPHATLRYRISYNNISNSTQHQVTIRDLLPLETNVAPAATATPATLAQLPTLVKNFSYTGFNLSSVAPAYPAFTAGTATVSPIVTFAPIASLGPALGGTVSFDVSLSTPTSSPTSPVTVGNTAQITTVEIPAGATASISATVSTAPAADVVISKTTSTTTASPGGTVTYTVTLTNNGSGPATITNIRDTLPGFGNSTAVPATDALTRLSFVVGSATSINNGVAGTAPTRTVTNPAVGTPNKELNTFVLNPVAQRTLAAGTSLTLTFSATVGVNVPAAGSPYTNSVTTTYTGAAAGTIMPIFNGANVNVNPAALSVSKVVDCVYDAGLICQPYVAGSPLPLNAKVRYKITYANTSASPIANVYLCDMLSSTQTAPLFNLTTIANAPIANTSVLSGGVPVTPTLTPVPPAAAIAACGFGAVTTNRKDFNYPVINPLDGNQSGIVYYEASTNVPVNPTATAVTLTNTAKLISSSTVAGPASSTSASGIVATPVQATGANLVVSKSAAVPVGNLTGHAYGGDLVNYTITVTNTGTTATAASTAVNPLRVVDTLPGAGAANINTRFSYQAAPPLPGAAPMYAIGAGVPTVFAAAPTMVLTGNSEAVTFTLPLGTVIPAGGTFTITFTAKVGTATPALVTAYTNSARATYLNGATVTTSPVLVGAAPVLVDPALQATKTIDCIYDPLPATTCTPYVAGSALPVNYTTATTTKIRYRIDYMNNSTAAIPFVFICDQMSSTQAAPVFAAPITASLAPATNTPAPNGPSAATFTNPAVAACGFAATGVRFNFAPITSLAAKTGGTVYFDAATNIFNAATLTNTAKVVSATLATGAVASATVLPSAISSAQATAGTANLVVSKTVDKAISYGGDTVRYTISVTNTGLAPATMGTIVDTLPGAGTGNVLAARFTNWPLPAPAAINNGVATAVPTVAVTNPAVAPALNRERVTYSIAPAAVIAPGKTLTLSFTASVGLNVTPSAMAYTNDVLVNYTGGPAGVLSASVLGAAPVTVGSNPLTINKSIVCVFNAALTDCLPYVAGAQLPLNAKVRYKIDYANTSALPIANVYLCDKISSNQAAPLFNLTTVGNATPTPSSTVSNTAVLSGGLAVTPTLPAVPPAAIAACGFGVVPTSAKTFNYPLINPLDGNQTGTVYYDATTNAANNANINNVVSIITTANPAAGVPTTSNTTAVSATVVPAPVLTANLVVTKSVAVPVANTAGHAYGGNLVTYTITVQNTGAAAGILTTLVDTLPGSGLSTGTTLAQMAADALRQFTYVGPSTFTNGAGVPTAITGVKVHPATGVANKDVVTFTLPPATSVAAGTSLVLTFNALVGANVTPSPSPYTNSVTANYTGGPVGVTTATVANTAPVVVDSPLLATKVIDCVYDLFGVCQAYSGSGTIPVNGSSATTTKVRYKISYANLSPIAVSNVYICDQLTSTQAAPVMAATITTPTTAPNPVGPYLNAPAIVLPAAPAAAVAACGFVAGGKTFNYPVIASLAANTAGVVFFDANVNVASAATLTNTVKLVSSATVVGPAALTSPVSVASAYAINAPNLIITKATTTPNLGVSGTATYTITVSNTGNAPTTSLKVYDFLPFNGTVLDPTKRFSYVVSSSSYTGNGATTPIVTPTVTPTALPFNLNVNQEQVLWDFGAFALAHGSVLTITFNASVGSAMPVGAYNNNAVAEYVSGAGPGSVGTGGTAGVNLTNMPSIMLLKTVDIYSDPVNGVNNPAALPTPIYAKFIPGAVAGYTIIASNSGGPADVDTISITDPIPMNTSLFVNDIGLPGSGPLAFVDGASTSGLTYTYTALANLTDDVDFFGGAPVPSWNYVPVPGADGCDPLVQSLRMKPKGAFVGHVSPSASFSFTFRVCVK